MKIFNINYYLSLLWKYNVNDSGWLSKYNIFRDCILHYTQLDKFCFFSSVCRFVRDSHLPVYSCGITLGQFERINKDSLDSDFLSEYFLFFYLFFLSFLFFFSIAETWAHSLLVRRNVQLPTEKKKGKTIEN